MATRALLVALCTLATLVDAGQISFKLHRRAKTTSVSNSERANGGGARHSRATFSVPRAGGYARRSDVQPYNAAFLASSNAPKFPGGDTLYEAMISVGTPPQSHRVILDTGGSQHSMSLAASSPIFRLRHSLAPGQRLPQPRRVSRFWPRRSQGLAFFRPHVRTLPHAKQRLRSCAQLHGTQHKSPVSNPSKRGEERGRKSVA